MSEKKYEPFFRNLICEGEHSLKSIIGIARTSKNIGAFLRNSLHSHEIVDTSLRYIVGKTIIYNKHPTLYMDLTQMFEFVEESIKFYQCKLTKESRLIFTIHKNSIGEETFIPLLFDVNHCIYIKKDKNYDNQMEFRTYQGDFKSEQELIKKYLLK